MDSNNEINRASIIEKIKEGKLLNEQEAVIMRKQPLTSDEIAEIARDAVMNSNKTNDMDESER